MEEQTQKLFLTKVDITKINSPIINSVEVGFRNLTFISKSPVRLSCD